MPHTLSLLLAGRRGTGRTLSSSSNNDVCVAVSLLLLACGPSTDAAGPRVTVFAAASTTDVVAALAESFESASGVEVRASFGASSTLARQIEDGAGADVFVSASRRWIEHLEERGLLAAPARVVATGTLVCVAPARSPLASDPPESARELAERLSEGARVAIADAGVPAGERARESLAATGDDERLAPRLVGREHVRAVLSAVAAGDVEAAFVYASDALVADVEVLFALPPETHRPIETWAAVPSSAPSPELAARFLEHLLSAEARELFTEAGFVVDAELALDGAGRAR